MSAGQTQERALEYLDKLESCAPIDSVEVGVWGKEVEVERTERAMRIPQLQRIQTRLEAFESWAARTGRKLEPFFRNTRIDSMIGDDSYEVWRLPTIALAEFDADDTLLHVAPCRDGERTIDVFDRLEALVTETELPVSVDPDREATEVITDRPSERTNYSERERVEGFSSRSD